MNRLSSIFRPNSNLSNYRLPLNNSSVQTLSFKTPLSSFLLIAVMLAAATMALPQVSLADTADELRTLQTKRFSALVSKDLPFLETLLSPLLSYTHSNGMVETKQAFLDNLKAGKMIYRSIEPREQSVIVDRDVGIVTGIGAFAVTVGGKDLEAKLRFTDVYVKDRSGQWKELAWQSLKLESAPEAASSTSTVTVSTPIPSPTMIPSSSNK